MADNPAMIDHGTRREQMLRGIERQFVLLAACTRVAELPADVRAVMERIPRERFVPLEQQQAAYVDSAIAIACGQTISQPFIVALMTALAGPGPGKRALEIGTGSGYQAAVLAGLCAQVKTLERIPELAAHAARVLRELGITNAEVRCGDGNLGWPDAAPFDIILVTCCAPEVPQALVDQLAPGGRLVAPVGDEGGDQKLVLVEKDAAGATRRRTVLGVRFVPMVTGSPQPPLKLPGRWEHFPHGADVGVRGMGPTVSDAFAQAAVALTAVVCDPKCIEPVRAIAVECHAPDRELLVCAWLNEVITEMATHGMLFSRFRVHATQDQLHAVCWGEPVDRLRHRVAVEPKGATLTELKVEPMNGGWLAQCVVDV